MQAAPAPALAASTEGVCVPAKLSAEPIIYKISTTLKLLGIAVLYLHKFSVDVILKYVS